MRTVTEVFVAVLLVLGGFALGRVDKQSKPKTVVRTVPVVITTTTSTTIVPECLVTINGFKVGMDPMDAYKIGRKCEK